MTADITAIPSCLDGVTRRTVGMLGVDGGVMSCRPLTDSYDYDLDDDDDHPWHGIDKNGTIWTSTGFGDGGYDIVETVAPDDTRVGIEVAFYSSALEAEVDEVAATLWGGEPPSDEERSASHRPGCDPGVVANVKRWHDLHQELWDSNGARLAGFDPAAEAAPEHLGNVVIPDRNRSGVSIGGPGTDGGGVFDLARGTYSAIAWTFDHTVSRFGLYRAN